jgi:hypothetical protein
VPTAVAFLEQYGNKRALLHIGGFFPELKFLRGFLFILLILPEETVKL